MVFIGMQLLYRFERAQYASTRKDYLSGPDVKPGEGKEMSAIYGAEHLLRMLGRQASCSCERLCLFGDSGSSCDARPNHLGGRNGSNGQGFCG